MPTHVRAHEQSFTCDACNTRLTSLELDYALMHPSTGEPCCPSETCVDQPLREEDNSGRTDGVEAKRKQFRREVQPLLELL